MKANCFFIFLIIQLAFCACNGQNKKVTWKETVGTLPFHGNGGQGQIDYEVDGKMYRSYFDHRNTDAKKDDKYTMRYNANNPSEIEVDYWNPVFIPGEKTSLVVAKITKVPRKNFWHEAPSVVFAFHVNNALLEKYIYLPPDYQEKYPYLKDGQLYEAECWEEDVNRVVLHLNKPISVR